MKQSPLKPHTSPYVRDMIKDILTEGERRKLAKDGLYKLNGQVYANILTDEQLISISQQTPFDFDTVRYIHNTMMPKHRTYDMVDELVRKVIRHGWAAIEAYKLLYG